MKSWIQVFRSMLSRQWWWSTLMVIIGIIVTVYLGFWQLGRLAQRREANHHTQTMQAASPVNLDNAVPFDDLNTMEYRQVAATGTYDFKQQIAIRNQFWTQEWGIETGYYLLTPLVLENGRAILVQRGWIPAKYDSPLSWKEFDEPNPASVEGIIRLPMKEGQMGGGIPDPTIAAGNERQDFWNFVNIEEIQKQIPYPLLGVYIQQSPNPSLTSYPYRSLPEFDLNDGAHLGYAFQWFFFTSLLIIGYPIFIKKFTEK